MNKVLFSLIGLSFLLAACTKNNLATENKVDKLSHAQISQIRASLLEGTPIEAVTDTPQFSAECEQFRQSIPPSYIQGTVEVPEDWSQPDGRKINVFYYGNLLPGKDAVVFYNGGPTGDSHSSFAVLSKAPHYSELSFIFVDQRGTGCSDPYPTDATLENIKRLSNYGSRGIVNDSEAIRKKLLNDQSWKIFGQSYGGHIVHRYMTMDISHVKSAHAHGLSLMSDYNQWIAMRMKSQKRVLEKYFEQFPSDRTAIPKIQKLISEDMCFNDGSTRVCGPKIMDGLIIFLGFSNSWPSLHRIVSRLLVDDNTLDLAFLKQYVQNYVLGVFGENYGAGSVIGAVDMSMGGVIDLFPCVKSTEILQGEGEDPASWILNECRLLSGLTNADWDPLLQTITQIDDLKLSDVKDSVTKNPQVPFYLYSGHLDVFVPFETFTEEITLLGNLITYNSFPNSGHEGFYTEELVWANLKK